jgi:hypothetical protein
MAGARCIPRRQARASQRAARAAVPLTVSAARQTITARVAGRPPEGGMPLA